MQSVPRRRKQIELFIFYYFSPNIIIAAIGFLSLHFALGFFQIRINMLYAAVPSLWHIFVNQLFFFI